MKIQRQKLIDVLTAVKPGLARKAIVDQATHFIMTGNEIMTYNDKICISFPFKTDFQCSIVAEEFYKILSKMTGEEINIDPELDEEGKISKLSIKGHKVNAHVSVESGGNILPMIESLKLDTILASAKDLPDDFIEAIGLCMFSAAKDMGTPVLSCILVQRDIVAATDDLRISEYKMKKSLKSSFLLPASAAMELVKFDIKKFAVSDEWSYFFTTEGAIFCSRVIPGKFPDYAPFLTGFDSEQIELPEDMQQMVETASILAEGENDQDRQIEIIIDGGKIKCKGQNKIGWIENETRIRSKKTINFTINAVFFHKILNHTKSMFFDGSKALFKSGEFRHVIALKG